MQHLINSHGMPFSSNSSIFPTDLRPLGGGGASFVQRAVGLSIFYKEQMALDGAEAIRAHETGFVPKAIQREHASAVANELLASGAALRSNNPAAAAPRCGIASWVDERCAAIDRRGR